MICGNCDGLGLLDERDEWGFGKPCPDCNGTGESLTEEGGVNESSSGVHGQQMSPLPSPENDRSGRSSASTSPPAVSDSPMLREEKLPCGCHATLDKAGYRWIAAEAFLCEAGHKQGDLVEVREGLARLPGGGAVSAHAWDDLEGARIEHIEQRDDGRLVLIFGHRGTDDGSGYLVVDSSDVHIVDNPDDWKLAHGDA